MPIKILMVVQYGLPVGMCMALVYIMVVVQNIQSSITEIKGNITPEGECELIHKRVDERLDILEGN